MFLTTDRAAKVELFDEAKLVTWKATLIFPTVDAFEETEAVRGPYIDKAPELEDAEFTEAVKSITLSADATAAEVEYIDPDNCLTTEILTKEEAVLEAPPDKDFPTTRLPVEEDTPDATPTVLAEVKTSPEELEADTTEPPRVFTTDIPEVLNEVDVTADPTRTLATTPPVTEDTPEAEPLKFLTTDTLPELDPKLVTELFKDIFTLAAALTILELETLATRETILEISPEEIELENVEESKGLATTNAPEEEATLVTKLESVYPTELSAEKVD